MLSVIVSPLRGLKVALEAVEEILEAEDNLVAACHAAQMAFQVKVGLETARGYGEAKMNPQKMRVYTP